jgi:hypothetical protein
LSVPLHCQRADDVCDRLGFILLDIDIMEASICHLVTDLGK